MLIRVTGGSAGIAEYLVHGQKQDRELARDELDERVILDGDLELTDTVIKGMEKEGERYLHITLAFKEDALATETLKSITADFKQFAMSAFDADEFNFYAEAHLPKTRSYIDRRTGKLIERKPHIHIVIPEKNLLSGQNLNPFGKVDQQIKFLEAFQEHANAKYGLASPKDHRRDQFTSESEMISRYKGDLFQGTAKALKGRILSDVLDRKISDYGSFKALLAKHGATRTRNAGQDAEYQNVKPAELAKGVNLKDYVFSREFIEKTDADKRQFLANEGRKQYESQQPGRVTDQELAARLKEWHAVRAPEIKYLNSGNRKLYAAYRSAERDEKRAILAERADKFYIKHRKEPSHDRADQLIADIADNLRAAGRNIESTSGAFGDPEQAIRNVADRRASRAIAALGKRLGHDQAEDRQVSQAAPQPRDRRSADNVVGQFAAEHRERTAEAKAATVPEFAQIKRELDARRLLAHLSKTHGVIPEKYEVTKGKDGADRIKAGNRNLNVSDFLTQEMRLSFAEAAPILREVHAAQAGREVAESRPEPRRELWDAFRQSQPNQAEQRARDWDLQRQSERERRAEIRAAYQSERRAIQIHKRKSPVERKAALSIVQMERVSKDLVLRETVSLERQQLKAQHRQPLQGRYRAFLAELANHGNEPALAELRRQRDTVEAPTEKNTIEGLDVLKRGEPAAPLARDLAYSIDRRGHVTYYADATRQRALVIDAGQYVSVASVQDREAVEVGLRLALQKFGPRLKIDGSDEFKREIIEVALKTGLRVEFDNKAMNDELTRRRNEHDELQARGKAFIDGERAKDRSARGMPAPAAPAPDKKPTPKKEQERSRTKTPQQPGKKHGMDR
ncbi:MAG: LPD7 domain-containing protein [Polaromonas sp.]|jgi:hypothetical protein